MGLKRVTRHGHEAPKVKWVTTDQGNKPKEQEEELRPSGEDPLDRNRVGVTPLWFFGHNSLVQAPIEVIQNPMES